MRGERFADHPADLKNFVDLLCLTHPVEVVSIHRSFLEAGSDIIEDQYVWFEFARLARIRLGGLG